MRLLAAEVAGSVDMVHNTRAEQLDEIAALLGALEDGNSLSIKPSARLAACVLLLRGVVFEGPDTPEQPKPTGSCTPTSSCAESEVGSSSGVSPPGPPPHDQLSWEHTSGANAQADGAVLKCTPPPTTPAPPVVKGGSGSSSEPQQPAPQQPPATVRGCCGRGRWQQGEGHGIVSFTFRIVRSKLGDGGRIKLGIVAQGADGSMQEALVFNPRSGNFTEMPHDLPDLTNGILGECLMPGNLAGNRATGALIEVQANTLKNELRFRVTDNKGHRHPWHTAIIRRKAVALPAVFAPFCRLGKPGDAVELVRCHVYIPGEAIREQLALPPIGVQLNELDKALSMPDPSASPADLSAGKLKLDEARAVQSMATEGSGCPFVFLDADALRNATTGTLTGEQHLPTRLMSYQELQRRFPQWLHTETLTLEDACTRRLAHDHVAVSHRWDEVETPDPSGVQLVALRDYLQERPHIKRVWLDFCCIPQKEADGDEVPNGGRSEAEQQTFALMLRNVNLLYLGLSVLILADRSYLSRFWTQFEAWLAMQDVGPSGLVSAKRDQMRSRCKVICVHGAPEALQSSLIEEWSGCTAQKAYEKLSSADVHVTNLSDKEAMLPKILELDGRVSEVARRLGLCCPPESPAVLAPSNKKVRRALAFGGAEAAERSSGEVTPPNVERSKTR